MVLPGLPNVLAMVPRYNESVNTSGDFDGDVDIATITNNESGNRIIRVLQNDGNLLDERGCCRRRVSPVD